MVFFIFQIPVSLNGKQRLEVILDQKDESREIQTSVEICIKPKSQNSAILSLHANNSVIRGIFIFFHIKS